jgi:hypothetical protein
VKLHTDRGTPPMGRMRRVELTPEQRAMIEAKLAEYLTGMPSRAHGGRAPRPMPCRCISTGRHAWPSGPMARSSGSTMTSHIRSSPWTTSECGTSGSSGEPKRSRSAMPGPDETAGRHRLPPLRGHGAAPLPAGLRAPRPADRLLLRRPGVGARFLGEFSRTAKGPMLGMEGRHRRIRMARLHRPRANAGIPLGQR